MNEKHLSKTQGYIVCICTGNLVNILCDAWKCYVYAKKSNRIVVVDTCHSSFQDDIRKYFKFQDTSSFYEYELEAFYRFTEAMTMVTINSTTGNWFDTPFPQQVILYRHHQNHLSHDVINHQDALQWLYRSSLRDILANVFHPRRQSLPPSYTVAYIPEDCSDHDKDVFLNMYREKLERYPFVLLTTDTSSIESCLFVFGKDHVTTFASTSDTTLEERNINEIVDFLLIGCASRLYVANESCHKSRFARQFFQQKRLVWKLIG